MRARRFVAGSLLGVCALISVLLVGAGSAWAGFTHNLVSEFTVSEPGSPAGSIGVAVEQLSGDVYVVDSNANTVKKFDSAGSPVAGWSLGAMTGPSEHGLSFPYGAAVDQTTGDLYVADFNNGAVDKFDSNGVFLSSFTGAGTPAGSFGPAGLATDSAGDVYVADMSHGVVDKFDSAGSYLASFGEGVLSSTNGVAVDAQGDIYATANSSELIELDSTGVCVNSCAPIDQNGSLGVAVDPVSGHVYSVDNSSIREYDSSGAFIDRFGEGHLTTAYGVAVNGSLGQVYASNDGSSRADIFGPAVVIPDVSTGPASNLTTTGATLTGTVNPDGVEVSSCRFEYRFGNETTNSVSCASGPGSGTSPVDVSANVTGLSPNTPYEYWLVASNQNGTVNGGQQSFTTLSPPLIDAQWVEHVSDSTVTVRGKIDPMGYATAYYLEYGTDTSYGSSVPVPDASIGAFSEDVGVRQDLAGLAGGTTYHYRFVATSANSTPDGPDRTFKTFPSPAVVNDTCPNASIRGLQSAQYLPECRAYELVSPADKEGGNITGSPSKTRAASNGNAVEFTSLTAFGDAVGAGAIGTEYIAQRGLEGWFTHAITPVQSAPYFPLRYGRYWGDFSSDLSTGFFYSSQAIDDSEPFTSDRAKLYLRTDLLSAGRGTYRLLSGCAVCAEIGPLPPREYSPFAELDPGLAGASEDFHHVIFESEDRLTREAPATGVKLYEWVDGSVRLAGILPDRACATPPCVAKESVAGMGASRSNRRERNAFTNNTISRDGSRIVFTAEPVVESEVIGLYGGTGRSLNAAGSAGNLYLREDGTRTVQLNVSERSASAPPDPAGWRPGAFMGASRDDSKIFFATEQALTDEDPDPAAGAVGVDLYMYDVNAPAGHHLTLITRSEPGVENHRVDYVPAVSEDGSYVYYERDSGADVHLYVWHDGTTRLIAHVSLEGSMSWGGSGIYGGPSQDVFRASPDGRHIVFAAHGREIAESLGYDTHNQRCESVAPTSDCVEVYVYSYDTNRFACASCDPSGERPMADNTVSYLPTASIVSNSPDTSLGAVTSHLSRVMSDDGSMLFFDTVDPLVRQDTNGKRDVYEYDTVTGKVSLISSGRAGQDSYFLTTTPSGNDVFFITAEQLVKADFDGSYDLYDARVEGGMPAQNMAPPALCGGDDCQGPAKSAPVFSLPSSLTFEGQGNPAQAATRLASHRAKGSTSGRLRRALKACRKKGKRRLSCERAARRRSGAVKSTRRHRGAVRGR